MKLKNILIVVDNMSVSGVYTGRMHVPHLAPDFSVIPENYEYSYIRKDELVHTPDFFDLNLKLNYTFVLNDHIKLQLNGGVQNLFNAFQKDLDKGGFRDSGYFYGPTQPRTCPFWNAAVVMATPSRPVFHVSVMTMERPVIVQITIVSMNVPVMDTRP